MFMREFNKATDIIWSSSYFLHKHALTQNDSYPDVQLSGLNENQAKVRQKHTKQNAAKLNLCIGI